MAAALLGANGPEHRKGAEGKTPDSDNTSSNNNNTNASSNVNSSNKNSNNNNDDGSQKTQNQAGGGEAQGSDASSGAASSGDDLPLRQNSASAAGHSPLREQLRVWGKALSLVIGHARDSGEGKKWALQLAACTLVRAACQLAKMRVNEASVVHQNLGDIKAFTRTQGKQLGLAVFLAILTNWITYSQQQLALSWRSGLTRYLHDLYFKHHNFYSVAQGRAQSKGLTDADVRITEDVPKLATSLASLVVMMANGCLDIAIFTGLLTRSGRTGQILGLLAQFYVVAVYLVNNYYMPVDYPKITGQVSSTLSALQQDFNRFEGQAATVSTLQGGLAERTGAAKKFAAALRAKVYSFSAQRLNDAMLYFFTTSTFDRTPLFWCSFLYFSATWLQMLRLRQKGLTRSSPSPSEIARNWGLVIRYHGSMVSIWLGAVTVSHACTQVMQNYSAIERIRSLVRRLEDFNDPRDAVQSQAGGSSPSHGRKPLCAQPIVAEEHDSGGDATNRKHCVEAKDVYREDSCIRFTKVDIKTPTKVPLVRNLSFSLNWGESLLLTGHNGAGKSSVVRCLGRLWKISRGTIESPGLCARTGRREMYYVPQRPYNAVGTLAEELCYPDPVPASLLEPGEVQRWLRYVDLGYLADGRDPTKHEEDWQSALSLGEQQRLGILRLFYHRPKFAILDECTSAVTGEVERRLYDLCARLGISCITIAHRPALRQYHQRSLVLTGRPDDSDGGYQLSTIDNGSENSFAAPDRGPNKDRSIHEIFEEYFEARNVKLGSTSSKDVERQRTSLLEAREAERIAADGRDSISNSGGSSSSSLTSPSNNNHPSSSSSSPAPGAKQTSSKLARLRKRGLPNLRAVLRIGLATHSSKLRSLGIILATLLRTDLYWRVWVSVGQVIRGGISSNTSVLRRGLLKNALYVVGLFLTDRVSKRLSQGLQLNIWESLNKEVQQLFFDGGVLHTAMIAKANASPSARSWAGSAGDTLAFSEALLALLDESIKPACIGATLMTRAVQRDGRSVAIAALAMLGIQKLGAMYLAPNLRELARTGSSLEARFRTLHARFRQNLEPIAFCAGGAAERESIEQCYRQIEEHSARGVRDGLIYQTVSTFLLFGDMLPLSIMRTLSAVHVWKHSDSLKQKGLTGPEFEDMWYYDNCTKLGFNTLNKIAALPDKLATLEGLAQNVSELISNLRAAAKNTPGLVERPLVDPTDPSTQVLSADRLSITTPTRRVLALDLNFEVRPGAALLVTGPNASGKTLLAGLLAGLSSSFVGDLRLNQTNFSGRRPHLKDLLMVPQRPYLAPVSLAGNVVYPLLIDDSFDMNAIQDCLLKVGLDKLIDRYGLDGQPGSPWEDALSGGEQQRLCLARCLFHAPSFALLDECTSMVSQDVESSLFAAVSEKSVVPITFSQRLVLPQYHHKVLTLGEETEEGWTLQDISDSSLSS
eukprot:CAMPEP_0206422120 /NCGR_PEP_ID=MMETSP0324_2-20121206/1888_1 /ASSEMBLY_ACC=CAM_ASM_000836 /TAXON_ID=2866 /ORGANISM="Crypthecodinium cohnii, Strain Seligo" /LENGTH=1438 /DNA_ID=CAMNT_0053886413 /DNA_START=91 /DNA_END=4407 /DNA_ORIENTATION=-